VFYYSRRRIASAIAEDCYILVVLFIYLFFPQNFATRRGMC